MRNKIIITGAVIAVIVGMVLYKNHFDKKEQKRREEDRESGHASSRSEVDYEVN